MISVTREELNLERVGNSTNEFHGFPSHEIVHPPPRSKLPLILLILAFLVVTLSFAGGTYYLIYRQQMIENGIISERLKNGLDLRLPDNIAPIYYKLEMIPMLEQASNFSLKGKVWIDVKCLNETSQITLHTKNLTIHKETVTVTQVEKAELPVLPPTPEHKGGIKVEGHEFDDEKDFYKILVASKLLRGKLYRIFIEYTGVLDDSMAGFYRSSYVDKDFNETRYIGATQFQATDARKAFPCFDEPALKAKFEVSVARRSNMSSISNMDLQSSEPIPNMDWWVWDRYKKSVPMSTYLVAVVVSDFESRISDQSLSKPGFRVWARKSAIQQAEFAKDIGPRILTFFEGYFGIEYPLPKQDMVALPDFASGAMENWGLITFRESSMLYDKISTSDSNKLQIALSVSHELAHQWFGNLVTPKWWNDLWLNEGFAAYTEIVGVDHISPEWMLMEYFVTNKVHEAFRLDVLDSSHPISVPVHNPNEINQIFDYIVYRKGPSIIRMMTHVLTDESYRKGLKNYLKKWSYMAVDQDDLWDSLTEQAHADGNLNTSISVADVMDSWTLQKGFPVIHVTRNYHDGTVTFCQRKFQIVRNSTESYDSYRWWVPISYATKTENADFRNTKPKFWLTNNETYMTTKSLTSDDKHWLIVNVQETGFYRVNYDERNWLLIASQLFTSHSTIHTVNRAQLIDDAFNLARANLVDYKVALNMSTYLKDDDVFLPWEAFREAFQYIKNMLCKSPAYGKFKDFVQQLVDKQYRRVGFLESLSSPETFLMKQHRTNIIRVACEVDHKDCMNKAVQLFSAWMKKPDPEKINLVPRNLRRTVYCTAIKQGGQIEWDFLWERYLRSNVANDKNDMLYGLGCSKDHWIVNRFLLWAISEGSGIRKQDGPTVFKFIALQDAGNAVEVNFVYDKWLEIAKHFGEKMFGLSDIFKYISIKLNTRYDLDQLVKFQMQFRDHLGAVTRAVDQAIETVETNVVWMDKNYKTISNWIETHVKLPDPEEMVLT